MQSIWINGQPSEELSVLDRAFSYGDGLFETIRVEKGVPQLLDRHLARLKQGLAQLKFDLSIVGQLLEDLAHIRLEGDLVMKWVISRGTSARGYALPDPVQPTRVISLSTLTDFSSQTQQGVSVRFCDFKLGINPVLAGIKHLNRLEQVLARSEWSDTNIAEGVVCDLKNHLVEGTMSNLFWVKDNCFFTPQITDAGVKGVMRDYIVDLLSSKGVRCEEGLYPKDVLKNADEVFLTNSVIEIWPVTKLEETCFVVGQNTKMLQEWIEQDKC